MSQDAHSVHGGHGQDDHPEPPPKKPKHGPSDCYGMPEKRFWRIVFSVAILTAVLVMAAVLWGNQMGVL